MLKTFTYATANLTGDWRKGKVISASRFNYVGAPFNATAEVRDTFAYGGAEGRASEHSRQLIFNGVDEGSSPPPTPMMAWASPPPSPIPTASSATARLRTP